jgi:D-arabinose 1-dehydrogenase-like Zn-dependent alcohol dehydrogenase
MQAMRLHEAGQHLVLEAIPVPEPRVGEVLV